MTIDAFAVEAAAHWNATPVRLISKRENEVFEVSLPSGRAALRLHRIGYQDDAAIRSELWWCAALAASGVRVPAALVSDEGGHLVTLSNGRKASCISWLEGEELGKAGVPFAQPLAVLLEQHRRLGCLVADVHRATARLTLPSDFIRPRWDIEGFVGETPFWGRFWDHPVATPAQRATLIRARAYLRHKLEAHVQAGARLAPIHADVIRENILDEGEALWLIDFDDSGIGFPMYDLGTAMSQSLYEPAYEAIRDALMAGYGTSDCEMVEVFTLARSCASVGWTMPRIDPDSPIHPRTLARACMWAEKMFARWP